MMVTKLDTSVENFRSIRAPAESDSLHLAVALPSFSFDKDTYTYTRRGEKDTVVPSGIYRGMDAFTSRRFGE
jgi:hypothetical protein